MMFNLSNKSTYPDLSTTTEIFIDIQIFWYEIKKNEIKYWNCSMNEREIIPNKSI